MTPVIHQWTTVKCFWWCKNGRDCVKLRYKSAVTINFGLFCSFTKTNILKLRGHPSAASPSRVPAQLTATQIYLNLFHSHSVWLWSSAFLIQIKPLNVSHVAAARWNAVTSPVWRTWTKATREYGGRVFLLLGSVWGHRICSHIYQDRQGWNSNNHSYLEPWPGFPLENWKRWIKVWKRAADALFNPLWAQGVKEKNL